MKTLACVHNKRFECTSNNNELEQRGCAHIWLSVVTDLKLQMQMCQCGFRNGNSQQGTTSARTHIKHVHIYGVIHKPSFESLQFVLDVSQKNSGYTQKHKTHIRCLGGIRIPPAVTVNKSQLFLKTFFNTPRFNFFKNNCEFKN